MQRLALDFNLCYKFTQFPIENESIMRKIVALMFFSFCALLSHSAFAILNLELTRGVAGALPIAIIPFEIQGQIPPQDVSGIISADLRNSGRFKVYPAKSSGVDNVVTGRVQQVGENRYQVNFQLLDVFKNKSGEQSVILDQKFVVSGQELRRVSHHISDAIYQQLTGVRGVFSTRLAYIVVQRTPNAPTRYALEVSDQDGYNPRPLLVSHEPIMSPAWSPNGKQIAYVSFENRHSAIYIEEVATGARTLVSSFPGINGAPAWSPDGRKLALVLSKSGSPNIYTMDLATRQLTQLTNDYYINTEPAWSKDGKSILFTSNRGGNKPQIYQVNLATKAVYRVTYEGKYNARASFAPDGNHIVVLNQDSGVYNIGMLDLDSGVFKILTTSGSDSQSPSIAPNGSMVLFGTVYRGRNVLGMAAADGSVQLRLPAPNGEVQDPAWSPFLS